MSSLIGQSLGRYHILEQLGEGGMATVYKARDVNLERDVAVKVIRAENFGSAILERILKRFEREAKSLARLTHPNIVPILDYGEYNGAPYLVMPYLPGGTLKERLNGPIPYREAVQMLIPIAQALVHAHGQGIIHRDIKPSNILITRTGEPMLSDFGIAKILDSEETRDLTSTGVGIGTPEYMAPEQGMGKADERADIYALGIVLYEMVTGRIPFRADTPMAVLLKKNQEPLPRLKQFVSGLPASVENVLIKALERDPNYRYQTMHELLDALGRLSHNESITMELPRLKKNNLTWIAAGIGGLIFLIVCVFGLFAVSRLVASDSTPTESFVAKSPNIPIAPPITKPTTEQDTPTLVLPTTAPPVVFTEAPTITSIIPTSVPDEIFDEYGVSMRYVPAGTFSMGSKNGEADERPVHVVDLPAFYMDKYEVTNILYKACVDAGQCQFPQLDSKTRSQYYGNPEFNDYPVIIVNWSAAKNYCEWRGARLPSEAEWEKAARGTDGRTYPWGEGIDCNHTNYGEPKRCRGDTTQVGNYESGKSPYGLYDMAGNVWEWVSDWYDVYPGGDPSLYPYDYGQIYRVVRGGSWGTKEFFSRSSFRGWPDSEFPYGSIGFRCARSAP